MAVRRSLILLVLATLASSCFVLLTVLVTRHVGVVERLDMSVHGSVRQYDLTHPAWLSAMRAITHLGDTAAIVVLDVAALVVCVLRGLRRQALLVVVLGIGVWALRASTSAVVGRARPVDALWPEVGFSFPSGHTANSAATATLVVIACWPLVRPRWGRIALVSAVALYALSIGWSRIAGGVHWPSDVVGGLLLAGAFAFAAGALLLPASPGPTATPTLAGLAPDAAVQMTPSTRGDK